VSAKIEGRMKSSFYVATVIKAYRKAIDEYYSDPIHYTFKKEWLDEISKASHREYTKGFYFNKPGSEEQVYTNSSYIREYDFVGLVIEYDKETGIAKIEQRNRIFEGDEIEVVPPAGDYFKQTIKDMRDEEGSPISVAQHAQMIIYLPIEKEIIPYTILRKKNSKH
jgi:putative protease